MIRVLLADDHEIVRLGLRAVLSVRSPPRKRLSPPPRPVA